MMGTLGLAHKHTQTLMSHDGDSGPCTPTHAHLDVTWWGLWALHTNTRRPWCHMMGTLGPAHKHTQTLMSHDGDSGPCTQTHADLDVTWWGLWTLHTNTRRPWCHMMGTLGPCWSTDHRQVNIRIMTHLVTMKTLHSDGVKMTDLVTVKGLRWQTLIQWRGLDDRPCHCKRVKMTYLDTVKGLIWQTLSWWRG